MLKKEFKVLPGPMFYEVKEGDKFTPFQEIEGIINDLAKEGWNFYSLEELKVKETPGCIKGCFISLLDMIHLGWLLGDFSAKKYYMYIFVREIDDEVHE